MSDKLQLQLSPAWMADYCKGLVRSTATVEKRLVALDAVMTFIGAAAGSALLNDKNLEQIKGCIESYIEAARSELMAESIARLSIALQQHDVAVISRIFTELSRSGFWAVLTQTMEGIEPARRDDVVRWSLAWLAETKRQGEEASPYPDSIDFKTAGIDIAEYTAMTDLCKYVESNY